MIDPKEFLKAGQQLHGHKCPAMPLGLRAGAAAMNALVVARAKDKDLFAVVELGDDHCAHCFADGVQMITGCTFGKGNIRKAGYGKFGVTLVDRATGRSVRVVPLAKAQLGMKQTKFFLEYRMKGVPASKVPEDVVDPLIQQVMNAPQEQLLSIGPELKTEVEKKTESFGTTVCAICGEMVVDEYLRPSAAGKVCIPCSQKAV
ncbi:FmdE family protein [Anaeromyxobacter oryzisoli]|uniref:FmdE family protein n=1 Tax=Anaeromyxobacter oryzisoli TaxID=2925408 RepID=UPI001F5A1F0A|nr:FmdE family protein [Anaeromyxobacter sp. SG63]